MVDYTYPHETHELITRPHVILGHCPQSRIVEKMELNGHKSEKIYPYKEVIHVLLKSSKEEVDELVSRIKNRAEEIKYKADYITSPMGNILLVGEVREANNHSLSAVMPYIIRKRAEVDIKLFPHFTLNKDPYIRAYTPQFEDGNMALRDAARHIDADYGIICRLSLKLLEDGIYDFTTLVPVHL